MLIVWIKFVAVAAIIALAGYWLSRFGDVIAERTGLSGSWIGLVMLATVTSLPELVTGIGSVTLAGDPDLAAGDALGSCLFNLLILSLIDLLHRPAPMFASASEGHLLSAGFGTILLGLVGAQILLMEPGGPSLGPVSIATPILAVVYLLALRMVFTYERRHLMEPAEESSLRYPDISLRRAIAGYIASALAVIAAGLALPMIATDLADAMGWTSGFVGTFLLALSTSLPELVVCISAVRIGALDMAVANLLGSNLFNMLVLVVDDLVYLDGPLFLSISDAHATTALAVLVMYGITSVGLVYRPTLRVMRSVSWVSLALVATYILAAVALALQGE